MWALRAVSFEVKQGEILGIIGRNGAGKSTLLKILSRVTAPTSGEVRVKGRIASLLEVGTGFHPELTGRENIFLNGAILGMSKAEIRQKFDEIVAFSEIEQFIDTPVKRYSSGMYVRLAFAVAAHLDPEILILDEVLAVGDAAFQKKCLGKMKDVAGQGRTVLFVSHNMEAVLRLCSEAILIKDGLVQILGSPKRCVSTYLEDGGCSTGTIDLRHVERGGDCRLRAQLVSAKAVGMAINGTWRFHYGEDIAIEFVIEAKEPMEDVELGIGLFSGRGFEVASWTTKCNKERMRLSSGTNAFQVKYKELRLLPGRFVLGVGLRSERGFEDYLPEVIQFEVVPLEQAAEHRVDTFGGVLVPVVHLLRMSCP
jgi:lipopolysaccharide transport system ATP-binding protein